MADVLIIGSVGEEQLLVATQKRGGIGVALIPEEHKPSAGPENAYKFLAVTLAIEPVSGLGCGHEIHAVRGKLGRLGGSGDAGEFCKAGQQSFAGCAHFGIRLNAENLIAVLEQQASPKAGAGG